MLDDQLRWQDRGIEFNNVCLAPLDHIIPESGSKAEDILASTAIEIIVAGPAGQDIVSSAAEKRVVSAAPKQGICCAAAIDAVVAVHAQ